MADDFIPYGRQSIDEDDIAAVTEVFRGDWLTTGPYVDQFEEDLTQLGGVDHAIAVNSGTAALHCAYAALGVGPGDEVIVPPLTFSATANAVRYLGATVVFADIDPETLTLDPQAAKAAITERTKAITAVDYAGHPADYDGLREVADEAGVKLLADACHSIGGSYRGRPVGSLADVTCFSFHPVKSVTTGEGGAVLTDDAELGDAARTFRTHGMERNIDEVAGTPVGGWGYDIAEIGYNYRITDFQCALGSSQLKKLAGWVERRQALAARYRELLADVDGVELPPDTDRCSHGYHLFAIRVAAEKRHEFFEGLRSRGVGVQVHYIPVNALTAYRNAGYDPADTPVTWANYQRLVSIPMYPGLTDEEQERVVETIRELL